MGEFVGKHFVAVFQQAGDFEVLSVEGKLRKNGGNVATSFCTSNVEVIHAVGQPVSAARLLEEARWAVDTFEQARRGSAKSPSRQRAAIERAHLAQLDTTPDDFMWEVQQRIAQAKNEYRDRLRNHLNRRSADETRRAPQSVPPVAKVIARRLAAEHFKGDRAHQIFAAEPLPPFSEVSQLIFEELTNETYAGNRDLVELAADRLQSAQQREALVVLVLYNGGYGPERDRPDKATEQLLATFGEEPLRAPLEYFEVVELPVRQLAALARLAELPVYERDGGSTSTVLITRSDGTQLGVMPDGALEPAAMATLLWPFAVENVLKQAANLVEQGESQQALDVLRQITAAPLPEDLALRLHQQIADTTFAAAETLAATGRTRDALRLLVLVQKESPQETLRAAANQRIAEIRGGGRTARRAATTK